MHGFEILITSLLVAFAQGRNSSWFPNWQSSWIEGGSDAAPGEFPYMVSVRSLTPNVELYCGGSIINNWYIMTAAHCVVGQPVGVIIIVAGTNKLTGDGQTYRVSRIIIHDAFDPAKKNNDIALLKLTVPAVFSATVNSVTLPNQGEKAAIGMNCIIMGWGKTSIVFFRQRSASSFPQNLQKLQLNIITNKECKRYYKYIYDTKICAVAGSGKGTCVGDSGGPLICGGKQVGILRGGGRKRSKCTTPFPVQFVNVPIFIDWIQQHAV